MNALQTDDEPSRRTVPKSSWLPALEKELKSRVGWVDEAVPAEVLSAALYTRFRSRQEHTFAEKMLSAMRQKFGGHVEPAAAAKQKA